MKTIFKQSIIAAAALFAAAGTAQACSTLIIGKALSETGNIIVAHNEDNGGRLFDLQHYVPSAKHKDGEMIKFEKNAAAIPQVKETLGFYWTQTFVPDGASFADGFFNDAGVAIATNWCGEIFDADRMEVKDGGIGYGIRRIVAERAHSAREAVEIATKLLEEYGYFHDGRTYTFADANEAWQLAIHQGNSWAAHKIADDEVIYIPNVFTMDKVDLKDTERWMVEPGQVERATKDGRFDPKKDRYFNWRKIVAPESIRAERWNANRNVIAWKFLTGTEMNDPEQFPYSVKTAKKLGVKDAMTLLRLHEDTIGEEQQLYHSASEGICRTTSHDSIVYNLTKDPTLTEAWKTVGRPCQSVYVPLYPLAGPAKGTAFLDGATATKEHFAGTPAMFDFRAEFTPHSVFSAGTNAIDYLRGDEIAKRTALIEKVEAEFLKERSAITAKAAKLQGEERRAFLHDYNQKAYDKVLKLMEAENARLMPMKVEILAKTVKADAEDLVEMALLGSKNHAVKGSNMKATRAGMSANQLNSTRQFSGFAPAESMTYKDVNGDGIEDVVFAFKAKDLAKGAVPGALMDLWLYTQVNGHRVVGFDVVPVETKEVKTGESRDGKHLL